MPMSVTPTAHPLPLSAVRLTGGPLKHAHDLDAHYLLALEPDRMMAHFRTLAGLAPKAEGYGGWDGAGRNLTGHIAGHYLSAVSLMYAATGDERFRERAEYLITEMREVQEKRGDGYLGALMDQEGVDGRERFLEVSRGEIRSGGFDLNGLWAPWYVQHKIFAGLRDAYRYLGSQEALDIEIQFAAWAESIMAPLSDTQTQQMLQTEFGGMNEVMADLYADTGDKRWLALSDKFEHRVIRDPIARGEDILGGLHGNTQIPKFIGSQSRFQATGDESDAAAARFFWDAVVEHHSFATGGHGKDEYFGPADELSERLDGRTAESCNIYNMLKLTRSLFAYQPEIKYAEFHEQALFNHVLGSIDPEDGRTCYMVPVGRSVQHEYQGMFEYFTCCVGSGMESHALHGDGIYYAAKDRLWINLYTPTEVDWADGGAHLTMTTDFPEGETAELTLMLAEPQELTLALRRPKWAGDGFTVHVNGEAVTDLPSPGSYVESTRLWSTGDTMTLTLPKALHLEPVPDNPRRAALLWGPLVLAGDMGPEQDRAAIRPDPVALVAAERPLSEWLIPVSDSPGQFRTDGIGRDTNGSNAIHDIDFRPFYRLHRRTYSVYWDLYTPEEWKEKSAAIAAEQEARRILEAATVAYAQPGEMQPERDFNQQGEETTPDRVLGRPGRRGSKWFSFDLPVDPASPMSLVVSYCTQEFRDRAFDITVDGQLLAHETAPRRVPGSPTCFFETTYPLPADGVSGKTQVTIRFDAADGKEIAAVYGLRTIRA